MPRRRGLTDKQVAELPRKDKRYTLKDPEQRGHYLRVPATRAPIAYAAVARDPSGKQIWATVGTADAVGIDQARELAREAIRRIKAGEPASEAAEPSVRDVAEEWLERYVRSNRLRSEREQGRIISRYIIPRIGQRVFADVRRKDIAELLDRIEDESGKPTADAVLKTFGAISKWVQRRDESYIPVLTTGINRVPKGEGRRRRILADDEIRAVWAAKGQYGDFVRLALLTGQRREKLITLRWDDLEGRYLDNKNRAPREEKSRSP